MEMDRQTIMVLFAAIIGLTLFGTAYLAPSKHEVETRPAYAADDIRHKFQTEDAKKAKKQNKAVAAKPIHSSSSSSSPSENSENEEPPLDDEASHEEPPIE